MIIRLPGAMLRFTDYQREFRSNAETLDAALESLMAQKPALRSSLLDGNGQVRSAHLLFINGDQLDRGTTDQTLGTDDCVEIVTAIAGG